MSNLQFDSFQKRVKETLDKFEKFSQIYTEILKYIELSSDQQKYFEDKIDRWILQLQNPEFPVAFLGNFSAGKSTIINALILQDLLPEGVTSTTAVPTIIKKGTEDKGIIHFMTLQSARKLRAELLTEIKKVLGKVPDGSPDPDMDSNNLGQYFQELDRIRSDYESTNNTNYNTEYRDKLEKLLKNWKQCVGKSKEINLSDLQKYVTEGFEYTLFVDKIEIYLSTLKIPSNMTLVDLPGMGVKNKRHVEFTKNYVKDEAKVLVICGASDAPGGEQEELLLEEISKNHPKILQSSFLVISKQDKDINIGERQRQQLEEFWEKTKKLFVIKPERFFKFSALQHLLCEYIIEKNNLKDTKSLKGNIKILPLDFKISEDEFDLDKIKDFLEEQPQTKAFSEFRDALFTYLNTIAIHEFVNNAEHDLAIRAKELISLLNPLYVSYQQNEDSIGQIMQGSETAKESKKFFEALDGIIAQLYERLSISEEIPLWDQSHKNTLTTRTKTLFSSLDVAEIEKKLKSENLHAEQNFGYLSKTLDDIVQNSVDDALQATFTEAITKMTSKMNQLLFEIKTVNPDYLPNETIEELEDQLNDKPIKARLLGCIDVLLMDYGLILEKTGGETQNQNTDKPTKERIKLALKAYEDAIIQFINNLADENGNSHQVDKVLKRSINNHLKTLKKNLLILLKKNEQLIDKQIAQKIGEDISIKINVETIKREIINQAYSDLVNLQTTIRF